MLGSLHGSGFRTTSGLASRALGDCLPQPVSFSPLVRAKPALPILPALFPPPVSITFYFTWFLAPYGLAQAAAGLWPPWVFVPAASPSALYQAGDVFPSTWFHFSLCSLIFHETWCFWYMFRFLSKSFRTWAIILAVYSRDFYTEVLIFKGPDAFPVWLLKHPLTTHTHLTLKQSVASFKKLDPSFKWEILIFSHIYVTFCSYLSFINGTSLVVQWVRICLPVQGTRVRALVWEDPTCCGATKPVRHNHWSPCA